MKPMNYPERKNQRRKDAIDMMENNPDCAEVVRNTEAKVVQGSARNVRTKKKRSQND